MKRMECAQTLRALSYAVGMRSLLENHRAQLKPEVIWNIEKGLALTGAGNCPRRSPARRHVPARAEIL